MTTSACYNLLLCLNLFYIVPLFVYNFFVGGHHPPESTGPHELRSSRCVCSEMLGILSRSLSAFKSTGVSTVHFAFQLSLQKKKKQVLLSPGMEEATAHHESRNHPLRKQTAKGSHANHWHVDHSTILLEPQVMVSWKLWG